MSNALPTWPGWTTVRLLGRGSSGSVYEITRTVQTAVLHAAMKVIPVPQSPDTVATLRRQGNDDRSIAALLQKQGEEILSGYTAAQSLKGCPQILCHNDIRQVPHADGLGFDILIMTDLHQSLTRALPQSIPVPAVEAVARDLCAALEYSHAKGMIHGRICPQDIFVNADGTYRLGGFGGFGAPAPGYSAPEVQGNQPAGTYSDIYSLGLVLYWMLNQRRLPFLPLPPAQLGSEIEKQAHARRFAGQQIPPPAAGSDGLKAIVLKALSFDPAQRYQTPAEMLADLNRLHSPQPTQENSKVEKGKKTKPEKAKKKKGKGLLIALICLLLAGGIAAGAYFFVPWDTLFGSEKSEDIQLKDYSGMPLEDAYQELTDMGMAVSLVRQPDLDTEAGTILSQSPAPGTPVKKGDAVSLVVSIGTSAGKRITVTFDPNGGTVKTASAILIYGQPYGDLPYPTRKGYSFDGWFTKPEGGNRIWKATEILAQNTDHTIYAQWTLNNYTITLDPCGGTLDTPTVQRNYGEAYGELPKPTLPGKEFLGWFTAPTGGERVWKGTVLVTDSNHTLYAQWNTNAYTVTLDPNGGKVSKDSVSLEYGALYGELPKPTRKGHTFVGWFTKATGGKQVWQSTALYIQADHTLYAQWTVNTYTVTLNAAGGTLDTKSVDIVYGTAYGELPRPTREGYTFEGWYTKSSGGERIWKGTILTTDQDHTLYAQWKKK